MLRLDLYSTTDTTTAEDSFFPPIIKIKGWTHRINAAGKLVFSIRADDENATEEKLRKYRRVRLYRRPQDGSSTTYEAVWLGYIESSKEIEGEIEVLCMGMLEFFKKRYVNGSFNGEGSTEAFSMLTSANSTGATGITSGTGGVTSTQDVTFSNKDMLRGWEQLSRAHGAEFEIDSDGALNFVSALGSDKSSTIELSFRRDGTPGGNIDRIDIGEDGEQMANRVIGYSSGGGGGLTSTQDDTTSQSTYGVLVERVNFSDAQSQGTLDSMASSFLTQVANPIQDYRIQPTLARKVLDPVTGTRTVSGLQYGDLVVGDLVTAVIQTRSQTIETTKRIAEITVSVDENFNEQLRYTLTESGVFVTAAFLDTDEVNELRRRIRELESLL